MAGSAMWVDGGGMVAGNDERGAVIPHAIKVLHVIPWLRQGGAEAMLASLVRAGHPGIQHHIHTLLPADDFFGLDPAVITSGSGRRGWPGPAMVRELRTSIARQRPDIVHGWMYHANFMTCFAGRGRHRTIWSIHNAALKAANAKLTTRLADRFCASASHSVPDHLVYVTPTVRAQHEAKGYDATKGSVIGNGVDLARFAIKPSMRLPADGPIKLVLVGRYDAVKGHGFLIDVVARHPDRARLHLSFVGQGCDTAAGLAADIDRAGLRGQCTLRGAVTDIEQVYRAADIVMLPSLEEAFPMTVLEAAASGNVICASRVGELATLGIDQRFMFAAGDAAGCATAITAAIAEVVAPTGIGLRNRSMAEQHSLAATIEKYTALYAAVINARRAI